MGTIGFFINLRLALLAVSADILSYHLLIVLSSFFYTIYCRIYSKKFNVDVLIVVILTIICAYSYRKQTKYVAQRVRNAKKIIS